MQNKKTSLIDNIKTMQPNDYIYLGIILVLIVLIIIIFFYSTNFVINNVNKIFTTDNSNNTQTLNIEKYQITKKKLNLE